MWGAHTIRSDDLLGGSALVVKGHSQIPAVLYVPKLASLGAIL